MPRPVAPALPLHHWTVLSLRPRGQHGALRAAARRLGARVLATSPIAIAALDDATARTALAAALAADRVLFTSPNAVRAAMRLAPLRPRRDQTWLAVGDGTRRALARAGIAAIAPARMDSEGLLDLPALANVDGLRIGLVTAPGGRGVLAPSLMTRGARVLRADVYQRQAVALPARQRAALENALLAPEHLLLVASSGEALAALLAQADATALRRCAVVAASPRLADAARAAGFTRIATASDPRPAPLLQAAVAAFATPDLV
ncbi:uroporphyrinogen-III synthase [Thermomonas sp.]|uniref:uroporphyrinogen-III synthase n=1 Tax=Thermomonas sp. TaxID=1971895 RepID=UPI0035B061FB